MPTHKEQNRIRVETLWKIYVFILRIVYVCAVRQIFVVLVIALRTLPTVLRDIIAH